MRRLFLIAVMIASAACRDEAALAGQEATPTMAAQGQRLSGRVIDQANVLSPTEEQELAQASAALEQATSDQLVIVTVPTLGKESLEHLGWALGKGQGVGQKDLDNGVLILVAPKERKVRVEVGTGLEGLLTDAHAADVVRAMMPGFVAGRPGEAILIGEDRIIDLLRSDTRRPQRKAA